jgi:hypothetical protein
MVFVGRAKGKGKLVNRQDLNRNIKRAGCPPSIGRPVMMKKEKKGCCCPGAGWLECTVNGKKAWVMKKEC